MAYVGGLLLMSMEEEDTFWALVSLFDRPKYLSGYYNPSMGKWVHTDTIWNDKFDVTFGVTYNISGRCQISTVGSLSNECHWNKHFCLPLKIVHYQGFVLY